MESFDDYIRETDGLFGELSKEIDLVAKLLPTETWTKKEYADPTTLSTVERRVLVRSIFSFIEALIYRQKIGTPGQRRSEGPRNVGSPIGSGEEALLSATE
jgi:hypothetical protein